MSDLESATEAPLPVPADDEVRLLLETIWEQVSAGKDGNAAHWPSYESVDRLLHRRHGIDTDAVLSRTSSELLLGLRGVGTPLPSGNDQLRLTVVGVAACSGTEHVIAAFLRTLTRAVEAENSTDGTEPAAVLASQVIHGAADGVRGAIDDSTALLARQVGLLLSFEPWTGSFSLYAGGWRLEVTKAVRRFTGITDLTSYWSRRAAVTAPTTVPTAGNAPGAVLPEPTTVFHVELTQGSGWAVKSASLWDLNLAELHEQVLTPRQEGRPVWRGGVEYDWSRTRVRIFEGPPTAVIPKFTSLLSPSLLSAGQQVADVTDAWITGPAGDPRQRVTATSGERRYQVFLSSTFVDLQDTRVAVTQELLKTGRCIPAGMELFGASSLPPWDVITRVLDVTDYFVLVLGHRYGSVPPDGGPSYTEREYDYAREHDIPVLAFVSDPARPVPPEHVEQQQTARDALAAFRKKVQSNHTVDEWSTPDQLTSAVVRALYKAMTETPRPGWVRGDN